MATGAQNLSDVQNEHPQGVGHPGKTSSLPATFDPRPWVLSQHSICIFLQPSKQPDCYDDIPQDYEVSVGSPPTNPVTGASEVTLGENSVVLDPAVRTTGLSHMYHEIDSFPQVGESSEYPEMMVVLCFIDDFILTT